MVSCTIFMEQNGPLHFLSLLNLSLRLLLKKKKTRIIGGNMTLYEICTVHFVMITCAELPASRPASNRTEHWPSKSRVLFTNFVPANFALSFCK